MSNVRAIWNAIIIAVYLTAVFQMDCFAQSGSFEDSLIIKTDTSIGKLNHLKTAGKVWKSLIYNSPGDFVQMGKVLKYDLKKTIVYAAGVSLVIIADKPITQWYQDKLERNIKYKLPKLPGSTGNQFFRGNDAYLNYSILALYGGALAANYETGQKAALNSLKALTYSYLLVHVGMKAIFARQRPNPMLSNGEAKVPNTNNPFEFFHFRRPNFGTGPDGTSFPSFHATAYYAVAKVMAMEFHNYWIPYSAVTFIFFADLKSHRHWVGDMIAGGLLGTLIGKGIVNSSWQSEEKKKNEISTLHNHLKSKVTYQLLPSISTNMTGISLMVSL